MSNLDYLFQCWALLSYEMNLLFRKQFGSRLYRTRPVFTRGLAVSRRLTTVTMSDTDLSECVQKIQKVSLEDENKAASSSSSSASSCSDDLLIDYEIEDVEALLKEGKVKNIVMVVGAGISTSAGIPDFRTPGTGLYRYFCN